MTKPYRQKSSDMTSNKNTHYLPSHPHTHTSHHYQLQCIRDSDNDRENCMPENQTKQEYYTVYIIA